MVVPPTTGSPLTILEAIGAIGFAVSGAMAATRRRMDVFGVAVLGVIAANSGGTLRDLLLSEPVSWLRHWWPIALAAGTALATIPIALRLGPDVDSRSTVLIADALGLAGFSILGCHTALNAGTPAGIAVVIGTISGITGGIIRDVLTGQPPAVFTGRFYAIAAIAGTALYALLIRRSVDPSLAWWISVAGVFALRVYALHRDWTVATIGPTKQLETDNRVPAPAPDSAQERSSDGSRAARGSQQTVSSAGQRSPMAPPGSVAS